MYGGKLRKGFLNNSDRKVGLKRMVPRKLPPDLCKSNESFLCMDKIRGKESVLNGMELGIKICLSFYNLDKWRLFIQSSFTPLTLCVRVVWVQISVHKHLYTFIHIHVHFIKKSFTFRRWKMQQLVPLHLHDLKKKKTCLFSFFNHDETNLINYLENEFSNYLFLLVRLNLRCVYKRIFLNLINHVTNFSFKCAFAWVQDVFFPSLWHGSKS